jgi:hypothetical protein
MGQIHAPRRVAVFHIINGTCSAGLIDETSSRCPMRAWNLGPLDIEWHLFTNMASSSYCICSRSNRIPSSLLLFSSCKWHLSQSLLPITRTKRSIYLLSQHTISRAISLLFSIWRSPGPAFTCPFNFRRPLTINHLGQSNSLLPRTRISLHRKRDGSCLRVPL